MLLKDSLKYLKILIKDRDVATIASTAKFAMERLCRNIDFTQDRIIVEYGPGTGVITAFLLERLTAGSKIIAIEKNEELHGSLENILDDRLVAIKGNVIDLKQILAEHVPECNGQEANNCVHHVISGIPFSLIEKEPKRNIVKQTHEALVNDGSFLVYQFSPHMKRYLEERFEKVHSMIEPINIPPLFIFEAYKRVES